MASSDENPDFSDVEGGSSSTAPAPEPAEQTYTVVAGDSLSKIAHKVYGEANHWRKIFDANKDQISDPDAIYPGQTLKIPAE
ncbi:MAG TPA: LysM peptidoglycan-binding domain-containing protein [Thermoanaerobaculia bacterium]|jgi:nucleoid-associated protein YgaU|nr:LysM peptidoglycan-binding domain-containing protein [Thermoanaerobaculia bacterium]